LSSSQKSSIQGDWTQAEVAAWTNGNYVVVFKLKDNLGTIRVVVDPVNGRVVEILT
jgi:transposase-like protein